MEGLVGKVTLRSGLIHSISNYWIPSISLELCYGSEQGRQGPCSREPTVWGQITTLSRGGVANLYRGPNVCQEMC